MQNPPFKFLDSYTKADKEIFFGREKETEEIYSRLFYGKMLLIYGPSGSGKTSLLQCGVANRFGEHDWKPIFIRRKGDISKSINAELGKQAITPLKEKQSIKEKLYSLYLDYLTPIYLIFDQFEELFIFGTTDEKQGFVNEIKNILGSNDGNTHLIFSIREEYLANLTVFEDDIPELFENRIRIEKMKKPQALEAIEEPCKYGSVELEEGVSEKVLERLETKSGFIELTWLQVIMDSLYKRALDRDPQQITIKNEDVDSLGKMGDVLGNFLDEQLKAMEEGEKGEAILKAMISSDGTKRQLTIEELNSSLQSLGHQYAKGDILNLLQHLINVRIISDKDDHGRYELKHDSLAAKIYEKLTLAEKELLEVRQFVENAYRNYSKTKQLLGKKELNYISIYEDNLYFEGELENFINESKQVLLNRDKAEKRLRTYAIIGFLLLITSFGYYAIKKNRESKMDLRATYSIFRVDDMPNLALQGAIKAYKKHQSRFTTKALYQSFYNLLEKDSIADSTGIYYSPYKKLFDFKPCVSEILFANFSNDEKYIYGYLADNTINIWSINGKELNSYKITENQIIDIKMSAGNKYISFYDRESTAFLLNVSGNILLKTKINYNLINPTRIMCFSPDEQYIAFVLPNGKVGVYNTDGSVFQIISAHTDAVTSLDFSNNSQFLATASLDNSVIIHYFNHNSKSFDLYNAITGHQASVWSVDFADNNKYVLTAYKDTSIFIWDFNGEQVIKNTYSLPNKYYFSSAKFSSGENYIELTQYDQLTGNVNITKTLQWRMYWRMPMEAPDSNYFKEIDITGSKVLARINKTDKIKLMMNEELFELYCFDWDYDFFILGNSNIILVKDSIIRLYPVNEDYITKLIIDEKIFGDIMGQKIWQINPFKF